MGSVGLDETYDMVRLQMERKLAADGVPVAPPAYWIVLRDAYGVACERLYESDIEPTAVLRGIVEEDGRAIEAALVSYVRPRGQPYLIAYVWSRCPDQSDVRRAMLGTAQGSVELRPWERTV